MLLHVLAVKVEAGIGSTKLAIFVFEVGVIARIWLQRRLRGLSFFLLRTYACSRCALPIHCHNGDSDGWSWGLYFVLMII